MCKEVQSDKRRAQKNPMGKADIAKCYYYRYLPIVA